MFVEGKHLSADILSEISFQAFFQSSHIPKALLNASGDFLLVNEAYKTFFEVDEQVSQEVNFFSLIAQNYPYFFQASERQALKLFEKVTKNQLQTHFHKPTSSTTFFYDWALQPIQVANNNPTFWAMSIYPQPKATEYTNFINQVLDTEPNLIMLKNFEGKIIFCDGTLADYCLVEKEDILGKTIHHFFQTQIPATEYLEIEQTVLLTQMELQEDEKFVRLVDGEVFYFHSIKKVFTDLSGNFQILCVMTDVTDKKRKQQTIENNRNLFNAISDAIPDDLFLIDVQKQEIIYANKNTFNNGYQLNEIKRFIQNNALINFLHEADKDAFLAFTQKLHQDSRKVHSLIVRILQKDNTYHWNLLRVKAFGYDEHNRLSTVLALLQDIHDEQEKEFKLKISERNLRQAHQLANIASWEYDLLSHKVSFSDNFLTLFGITHKREKELVLRKPQKLLKYIHLEDKDYFQNIFWDTLQKNQKYEGEHQITRKNGDNVYVYVIVSYERDSQGQANKINGIVQDISAQKLKQTQLQKQFLRTETIYNLTSNIADNLQDQIYKVIRATCNLLGVETGMILQQQDDEFVLIDCYTTFSNLHKGMTFAAQSMICQVVTATNHILVIKNVADSLYNDYECVEKYNIVFYLGVPIWINGKLYGVFSLWSSQAIRFEHEDDNFVRMILQWISAAMERNIFEKELIIAKEKAEQASKAKAHFLSTISHELRTPLNSVLGFTHLLLQKKPRKDQEEALKTMQFSAQNLLMLINDLLDLSKIEARKIELESTNFSLKELVQHVMLSLKPQADEKNIQFNVLIDSQIPELLLGDSLRIGQILLNLISNAIKFTERGKVEVKIILEKETEYGVELYFSIQDTGIGIAKDKINLIFDAFAQASTDITRKFGGTGLGLSITKKLLELHNTILWVESELDKGSTFSFYLKLPKVNPHRLLGAGLNASEQLNKPEKLQNVYVLVVEDHPTNRLVIGEFLANWQINADFASNGKEAIEMLASQKYQLVLMDLQMPVLDGFETTQKIRKIVGEYYQKIPIIALTADTSPNIKTKIKIQGMNDYISKPFKPEQLYKTIVKHLEQQNSKNIYQLPKDMKLAQSIFQLSQENPEFKQEFIRLNIEYLSELPIDYAEALFQGNAKLLGDIAHKAKPTIEMLGIPDLSATISEGRTLINEGINDKNILGDIVEKIKEICTNTIEDLQKEIKTS